MSDQRGSVYCQPVRSVLRQRLSVRHAVAIKSPRGRVRLLLRARVRGVRMGVCHSARMGAVCGCGSRRGPSIGDQLITLDLDASQQVRRCVPCNEKCMMQRKTCTTIERKVHT